jgi:hypothetical protein
MRGKLAVLAAVTLGVTALGVAPAGAAASYGPGKYQTGPSNADPSAYQSADPATGKVVIFQRNTRQAAAVNCVGDGPRATLLAVHPVTEQVSSVQVSYSEAFLSDHEIVMDVYVAGDKSGPVGHKATFGPMTNGAGAVDVPLWASPGVGEVLTVQFGLQTGAGCLPHPQIGLAGSRLVNGGQAVFTDVRVG